MTLELAGIIAYIALQFAVGIWASGRIRSERDYFLAGGQVGYVLATFSIFATWFGAETCMGSAGAIYKEGLSGARSDPFGYAVCLVLMGGILAARLWRLKILTLGDLLRERYSPAVEYLGSLILAFTALVWAAVQVRAFGQVLSASSGLGFYFATALAAGTVIAYTATGGLKADIITDLVQGLALIVGLAVVFGIATAQLGGPLDALSSLEASRWSLLPADDTAVAERLDGWAVAIIGSLVAQEMIARILAAKSARVATYSTFSAAGLYLTVGLLPAALGLVGHRFFADLKDSEQFLPLLARECLPTVLYVVFAGAVISAILSTVDSALLAVSSLLSHDLVFRFVKEPSEPFKVRVSRAVVVACGVTTYFLAVFGGGMYKLLKTASGFGSSGIVVITLFGLFSRFGGSRAALATLVAGIASYLIAEQVFELDAPYLISLAAAALTFVLTEVTCRVLKHARPQR
jgi:SSS family transporter